MDVGGSCPPDEHRIQPSSPNSLVYFGVRPERDINEAPDWGLIIGVLVFLAACVLMLVIAVIVWRPKNAGFYPMKHWAPRYRSLGAPPPVPHYMIYDDDHWPDNKGNQLGERSSGDGAEMGESYEAVGYKGEQLLEEFNVHVFYDKLEDQNLHLASQLARHREDLQQFYDKISQQNQDLKDLLNKLDLQKLEELERQRREAAEQHHSEADVGSVVDGNVNYRFTGPGREAELMMALKILIDRINSGKFKITPEMVSGVSGKSSVTYKPGSIKIHGQNDLLRRQNAERLQLERDLMDEEELTLKDFLSNSEEKRNKLIQEMGEKMAFKLQGDLSDAEAAAIIAGHERELKDALHKHDSERERQISALRQKLAEKRRKRIEEMKNKHSQEAEEAGLPKPLPSADLSDVTIQSREAFLHHLAAEESAQLAAADTSATKVMTEEELRRLSEMMREHLESLAVQGLLSEQQKDELVKKQLNGEQEISEKMKHKYDVELSEVKKQVAKKRQKLLEKLQQQQEQEKSELSAKLIQDGHSDDTDHMMTELSHKHQKMIEAMEAELDAEEAGLLKELTDSLSGEHITQVKMSHQALLNNLPAQSTAIDGAVVQKFLDQYRQDSQQIETQLQHQKQRQTDDVKAKLALRRSRLMAAERQRAEEFAAKRIVDEQERQMSAPSVQKPKDDMFKQPEIKQTDKSSEEVALEKQQERINKELRERHKQELQKVAAALDKEAQQEEQKLLQELNSHKEQMLREKANRQAAELQSRPDLTQEEVKALMASHAAELELMAEKLDADRQRQLSLLRDKMAAKRKRKMDDLRHKQEAEITREMLLQQKEMAEIRSKKIKKAEQEAISEGIRENGEEDSDKVVQAVLAERQAKEMQELDKHFAAEKKVMLGDALLGLNERYDKLRDDLQQKHEDELARLKAQKLSPEEYQQQRAQLLNRQQLEMAQLDQRQRQEQLDVERNALIDWELTYARAKLDLKEKHYKEFSDALRQFAPKHESVQQAEAAAKELEQLSKKLDIQRKEFEKQLKKDKKAFEAAEQQRLEEELRAYNQELEEEMAREKQKYERNIEALNKRKEDMINDRKKKFQEELERLQQRGASEEEQEQLLAAHKRDLQNLANRVEADKLRMQSNLKEKLQKKREERLAMKQKQAKEHLAEIKRELAEKQQSEITRLKTDEVLTIKEAINMDIGTRITQPFAGTAVGEVTRMEHSTLKDEPQGLPESYKLAAPLNEADFTALLMSSPLYRKLENIKKLVAEGAHIKTDQKCREGEGYIDPRDAEWMTDDLLKPMDLNKISSRSFVIYKFACFAKDLVSIHCHHKPLTLLLAEKIPANKHLTHNAYRNSFYYDANNHLLYMRAARLDSVGEFILVLIHCMAHIKAGDLRDDSNPEFAKEFYRALSVVCDDLFFARYQRDTAGSADGKGEALLAAVFGDADVEDQKTEVVDKLLDTRLSPVTDGDGIQLNKERLADRLNSYSQFGINHKLRQFLGDVEEKVLMAAAGGTKPGIQNKLMTTLPETTTGHSLLTRRVLPESAILSNMTGRALWQTFANMVTDGDSQSAVAGKPHTKQANKDELVQEEITKLENRIDDLNMDFSKESSLAVELEDIIEQLDQEHARQKELVDGVKGKDKGREAKILKETTRRLNKTKEELVNIRMKQKQTKEALEEAQVKLAELLGRSKSDDGISE